MIHAKADDLMSDPSGNSGAAHAASYRDRNPPDQGSAWEKVESLENCGSAYIIEKSLGSLEYKS